MTTLESLQETLKMRKSLLKDEEKKLRRYRKMAESYSKKAEYQVTLNNQLVGRIGETEDKIRVEKLKTPNLQP